ncbi:hypothetical protein [Klebsiella pneumoniae]|uniref:hypothetical protein n=1 Tax=Klebsiella pneumoniae TaxID=573 RepID=UPI003CE6AC0C
MATKRPRTTLLLTDELMTAIRSLSDVSGMTMSSIGVQFLEPSIPVMKQLEEIVLEAKKCAAGNGRAIVGSIHEGANKNLADLNLGLKHKTQPTEQELTTVAVL